MDQAKHRLPNVFGPIPSIIAPVIDPVATTSKIAVAVANAQAKVEDSLSSYRRVVRDEEAVEIGFESIWLDADIEMMYARKKLNGEDKIDILQYNTIVAFPFFFENEERMVLQLLQNLQTIEDIIKILEKYSRHILLVQVVSQRIVKEINQAIAVNLSIPDLRIEDINDWPALLVHIGEKLGIDFATKLVAKQNAIINNSLRVLDVSTAKKVTADLYGDANEASEVNENNPHEMHITYFYSDVSITLLNSVSSELDLDFVTNTSAQLTQSMTPEAYGLAKLIFENFDEKSSRHFIRTMDRRVVEITKGWINTDAILISLVQ